MTILPIFRNPIAIVVAELTSFQHNGGTYRIQAAYQHRRRKAKRYSLRIEAAAEAVTGELAHNAVALVVGRIAPAGRSRYSVHIRADYVKIIASDFDDLAAVLDEAAVQMYRLFEAMQDDAGYSAAKERFEAAVRGSTK